MFIKLCAFLGSEVEVKIESVFLVKIVMNRLTTDNSIGSFSGFSASLIAVH